jgi:large subunit ribosomal protein L21
VQRKEKKSPPALPVRQRVYMKSEVLFMFAVVETGGKQYKVEEGDVIFVEKLDVNDGDEYTFDKVLAVGEGDKLTIGAPTVAATVKGKIVKNGKAKKIYVMTYKAKKNEKRKLGHRQPYTKIQIESIAI